MVQQKKSKKNNKISIIIPAYNEEKTIAETIARVRAVDSNYEVVVVDDGSADSTTIVAKKTGVKVITFEKNKGKGAAFKKGIEESTGDIIAQVDADSQFPPEGLPDLIGPILTGRADLTFGSRFMKESTLEEGSLSIRNKLANHVDSALASLFSGVWLTDVQAGFKAFSREAIETIDFKEESFAYEPEIAILASRKKLKILDVPIHYKARSGGKSNIKLFRDTYLILKAMLKARFLG